MRLVVLVPVLLVTPLVGAAPASAASKVWSRCAPAVRSLKHDLLPKRRS